jgi:hypothetical protein
MSDVFARHILAIWPECELASQRYLVHEGEGAIIVCIASKIFTRRHPDSQRFPFVADHRIQNCTSAAEKENTHPSGHGSPVVPKHEETHGVANLKVCLALVDHTTYDARHVDRHVTADS